MRVPTIANPPPNTSSPRLPLSAFIASHRPSLSKYESIRRHLHSHPELSLLESSTAAFLAAHLRALSPSLTVHTSIGGHGVAAVLANGPGPTILLRSDTDALPVLEQTDLPYASHKTMRDADGALQPVMHACGHDIHMTCLLAVAETMLAARASWSGTLEFVFQPAEEKLAGARKMVEDGLYERIPVPDVVLGQHVHPERAGQVKVWRGDAMAASDSFKITFFGRGAHASTPQSSIDPVVMAASAVVRLQGIVSREVAPTDEAVVTVAAIHGGGAENVIEDRAFIRVNVRSFKVAVRAKVLAAIKRIVEAEAAASGAPRMPEIEATHAGPKLTNDVGVWEKVGPAFKEHFGDQVDLNFPKLGE